MGISFIATYDCPRIGKLAPRNLFFRYDYKGKKNVIIYYDKTAVHLHIL